MSVARALSCSLLASLPLGGLVLFFELTKPASATNEGCLSRHLSDTVWRTAFGGQTDNLLTASSSGYPIPRLGVSAEVHDVRTAQVQSASLTALGQAFSDARSRTLRVGGQTQFISSDGHRIVLRILRRDPISDEPVPDNRRMMQIAPASTANVVSFVWGQWRYAVEIEDRDRNSEIVVQKSL